MFIFIHAILLSLQEVDGRDARTTVMSNSDYLAVDNINCCSTVLPAKSVSDFMFVYKVIRD